MSQYYKYDVVIATYNGASYLKEQLDSIICQSIKPCKIYIRDDGSLDQTKQIIEEFSTVFKYIEVLSDTAGNLGYVKNFETLSRRASSEIVFFSDQDDVWHKDKAKIILEKFQELNVDACFTNANVVNEKLEVLGTLLAIDFSIPSTEELLLNNCITGATLAVKKKLIHTCLPFPANIPHDFWIASIASLQSNLAYIPNCLINYRQHSSNVIGVSTDKSIVAKILNITSVNYLEKSISFNLEKINLVSELIARGYNVPFGTIQTVNKLSLLIHGKKSFPYLLYWSIWDRRILSVRNLRISFNNMIK